MTSPLRKTDELKLAMEFVQQTGNHIFLTGKAGTGKTTFLQNLKGNSAKRMVVTAPTGVAAINAGGVTLHSFFQLPFGPFIPGSQNAEINNPQRMFRFSKEKLRIIQCLDLLVIDEISMVRADLLDSVDYVLRRLRRDDQPFGGVQLLMIGDLYQLPPVAKPQEWQLLEPHYESPYFFSSHALNRSELVTIELSRIFRQSDAGFIDILNKVRDNKLDPVAMEELNRRYIADYTPEEGQGYITLTTHNRMADSINKERLLSLAGKEYELDASISDEFPEYLYPTPKTLTFKKGAQVMFLRNDASGEKKYFNGKIGRIKRVSSKEIVINCPGEFEDIEVEPVEWENIKYTVNEENKEIEQEIIGRFRQFPLKLAWAITIHKSQGLTFEKAVIDAESAFAQGQVYVALSRCKTMDGMVLSSPVPSRGIKADSAVIDFVNAAGQTPPSESLLEASRIKYQQRLLLDCFDLQPLKKNFNYLVRLLSDNAGIIEIYGVTDLSRLQEMSRKELFPVSEKFRQELCTIFERQSLPETDGHIKERVQKASAWFQTKLSMIINDLILKFYIETDNKELGKRVKNAHKNLRQEIVVKYSGIQSCENGFSPARYLRALSKTETEKASDKIKKPPVLNYDESDIKHPELYRQLKDWRNDQAGEKGVPQFQILHQQVLIQIASLLPDSRAGLKSIKGVGKKTIEKYGEELLAIVSGYQQKHGLEHEEKKRFKQEVLSGR